MSSEIMGNLDRCVGCKGERDLLDEVMQSLLGSVGHEAETIDRIREIVGEKPQGRRIVQIAASAGSGFFTVAALTDDGVVFENVNGNNDYWRRLPDIPQDTPVDPDPIAELEWYGARLVTGTDNEIDYVTYWHLTGSTEVVGPSATVSHLRAAAARLLERVRGVKS